MVQTVRVEKVDKINWIVCLISVFASRVMVLKLSKKVHFLQFCTGHNKKSRSNKANVIYASGRSCCALSENVIVCCAMRVLGFQVEEFR